MDTQGILEQFDKDTADHVLTVTHDEGVHRCMSYRKPGTGCMGVQVTTWPGHIAISGDMGCYVFSRTEDMFTFHRRREDDEPGRISWNYWAEKVVAQCKTAGVDEFDPDYFKECVEEWTKEYLDEHDDLTEEEQADLVAAVNDDVLSARFDGEHAACAALYGGECGGHGNIFPEACDWPSFRQYTHHFIWACYCIERVIDVYDEAKASQ